MCRKMLSRRRFLSLTGAASIAAPATAHTPYKQWVIYRQKHLLVGSHRGDLKTYALAQNVVAGLQDALPDARARVARGPRPQRIASLIVTGQLFLAVLSDEEAQQMVLAQAPFEGFRPAPLSVIADLGDNYLLFAATEFPDEHAFLVAEAVDHSDAGFSPQGTSIDLHPGASKYWLGGDL